MALTKSQYQLMTEWHELSKQLEAIKVAESEARDKLCKALYPEGVPKGTNHVDLPNGYRLNLVGTINYSLDIPLITNAIKTIREKLGNAAAKSASDAIKTKYELKVGDYNKLPSDVKLILNDGITGKPGKPQLEIVKPKR